MSQQRGSFMESDLSGSKNIIFGVVQVAPKP